LVGRLLVWLHIFGLACLGGAVLVNLVVVVSLWSNGVFVGFERNPWVVFFEIMFAVVAAEYLLFVCSKFKSLS